MEFWKKNKPTCPFPDTLRSRRAAIIPIAQTKLPPAKSAKRLIGA